MGIDEIPKRFLINFLNRSSFVDFDGAVDACGCDLQSTRVRGCAMVQEIASRRERERERKRDTGDVVSRMFTMLNGDKSDGKLRFFLPDSRYI